MELDSLRNSLWADVEKDKTLRVFSLQDAAADPRIHPNLVISLTDHDCLYQGRIPPVLAQAAPYLVRLPAVATYTRWFLEEFWGNHWGILLHANATQSILRAHFQRLLLVNDEAGGKFAFRFYDPRVLRVYLPTCTPDELKQFFGPVARFFCESEDGRELLAFERIDDKLRMKRIPMSAAAAAA